MLLAAIWGPKRTRVSWWPGTISPSFLWSLKQNILFLTISFRSIKSTYNVTSWLCYLKVTHGMLRDLHITTATDLGLWSLDDFLRVTNTPICILHYHPLTPKPVSDRIQPRAGSEAGADRSRCLWPGHHRHCKTLFSTTSTLYGKVFDSTLKGVGFLVAFERTFFGLVKARHVTWQVSPLSWPKDDITT